MNRLESKLLKINNDSQQTAKLAGLRYFTNSSRGFYRHRNGKNFIYKDENDIIIAEEEVLARFKAMVLPPAWENVWISPYENSHLQATGIDSKGRKQYRYHANWNKLRNQSKFYRLREFAKALPKIRNKVEKDLNRKGLPYEKVIALVIKLIEVTNIRIGNEAYKKLYGSFGLTTLMDKHAKFKNGLISFEFKGKKGVKHQITLKDKRLMRLVKRCRDIPGQELFQYYDDQGNHRSVGSGDINNYLKECTAMDFTAKDFRCWSGSLNALCSFLQQEKPLSANDCKKKIISVLDSVSSQLGNTRTVCKKYYVHPTVIASFESGRIWKYQARKSTSVGKLNAEEKILVKLLSNEKIAEVLG
ncbi:DNA topoisomerase IB [Flavobacterium algicola]|uniref:DNA topoisomerase IB n=1 Tax=Flavobacterium algicola TaxID=556529 RepID=UPI001EFED149|nr:DNA topoisomerase IB [Flavobacterium algicola]MCG9792812.1 DNA topoisomerase IB [Flavobacterium algicola]